MKVDQRKLFNNRPARNKLSQMGGIMASSPELMQTVQGYRNGGDVTLAQMQEANDPRFFSRLGANLANLPAAAYDTLVGFPASTLQNAATAVQFSPFGRALGMSEPGEERQPYVGAQPAQAALRDILQANQPLTPEQVAAQLETAGGGVRLDPDATRQQLASEILGSDYRLSEEPTPDVAAEEEIKAAEEEAAAITGGEAPQTEAELTADSQDNKAIVEAAKKGELGAEEQVKAIVSQGTPEEREQSLASLMNEFKQNAPEYKGMDRGLAIAKIGFAMAAGQDPRAIVNISKALGDGADMMIKDEKERSAFQRQVDLSALQYGLGEIGKRRAQDRLDKRTFREYVADEGFTWKGKKYESGDSVLISQSDILRNGGQIPDGLQDKAVYAAGIKASAEKAKAFTDALDKMKEEAVLSDTAATKISEQYGSAVSNFQSAEVGVQLLENAILDVAEGEVTGFANGFGSAMNKVANAAGIQLDQKFESVDQFKATLRRAFQKLIPTTLGEAQSANSISNRDVEFLADAYINAGALQNGVFSLAFVDEDVLVGQLQGAIGEFRKSQQAALNQMTTMEGRLYGRIMPGTRAPASTLVDPYRQSMSPYMPGQTGTSTGLVKGDDGVFRFQ